MTREEYLERWSVLHGTDPRTVPLVHSWLVVVHALARPLVAARVPPDAVTALGLLLAVATLVPAAAGGRWALAVPLLALASGVADSLDGAVAVMTSGTSAWGAVLDAACDRVGDAALAGTLWLLGAPAALVVGVVGAGWLHEYVRARVQATGRPGPVVITVSERPTRVALPAMVALGAGLMPASATTVATLGAVGGALVAAAGLAQLAVAVRRALRPAAEPGAVGEPGGPP